MTLEVEFVLRRYGMPAAARDLQLHVSLVDGQVMWQEGSQPAPQLKLPVEIWNRYTLKARCFAMAQDLRRHASSRDEIRREIDDCVADVIAAWSLKKAACDAGRDTSRPDAGPATEAPACGS